MQTAETFWGLTATGWTAIGSTASAVSILILVIFNVTTLNASIAGLKIQVEGIKLQLAGVLYSGCPVLILRKSREGNYSIYNCGQGPALMAQWGYGRSIPEAKVQHRLNDNIIPAGDSRSIDIDMQIGRAKGIILFAYSLTNDKFVTSISWPNDSDERRVHFGTYDGEMPSDL